jgi:hypothetical protein
LQPLLFVRLEVQVLALLQLGQLLLLPQAFDSPSYPYLASLGVGKPLELTAATRLFKLQSCRASVPVIMAASLLLLPYVILYVSAVVQQGACSCFLREFCLALRDCTVLVPLLLLLLLPLLL